MSYLSQDDSISSFSQERLDLCPGMQNFGRRLDSGVATSMQNYSKSYDGTAYVNQQQTLPPTGSKEKQFQLIARHVPEGLRLAISAGELLDRGEATYLRRIYSDLAAIAEFLRRPDLT